MNQLLFKHNILNNEDLQQYIYVLLEYSENIVFYYINIVIGINNREIGLFK